MIAIMCVSAESEILHYPAIFIANFLPSLFKLPSSSLNDLFFFCSTGII